LFLARGGKGKRDLPALGDRRVAGKKNKELTRFFPQRKRREKKPHPPISRASVRKEKRKKGKGPPFDGTVDPEKKKGRKRSVRQGVPKGRGKGEKETAAMATRGGREKREREGSRTTTPTTAER